MENCFTFTKTPLLICSNRRSCRILRGLGAILLILYRVSRILQRFNVDQPLDANHKDELGLWLDVHATILLCVAPHANLLALAITILLGVLLGTLEDDLTLLLAVGAVLGDLPLFLVVTPFVGTALLQEGLRDHDIIMRGNACLPVGPKNVSSQTADC